jgi:hypothetical protein
VKVIEKDHLTERDIVDHQTCDISSTNCSYLRNMCSCLFHGQMFQSRKSEPGDILEA